MILKAKMEVRNTAELSSFFNAINHDRKYNASHWADYFKPLFCNGVFNNDLQVIANGSMQIMIKPGYAWINGYGYHNTDNLILDIETASGNLNRVDSIVLRLDLTERKIGAIVRKGNNASQPVSPQNERTGVLYDIKLADINVAAGTTNISQSMITDKRMDSDVCGWVTGSVEQIDFSQISVQFETYFNEFQTDNLNNFNVWFERMKEQLSEEAAGNLQLQLDNKVNIVVSNQDIPINNRKVKTFYYFIKDRQSISMVDSIRVSPNMGIKLI